MDLRHACCSIAAFASVAAWAEGGAVPPPSAEEQRAESLKEPITQLPANAVRAAAVANQVAGKADAAEKMLQDAKPAANYMKRGLQTTNLVTALAKDGATGLMREGQQIAIDEAKDQAKDSFFKWSARRFVTGTSTELGAGSLGLAFDAGLTVGGYLRDNTAAGRAINDGATDTYFSLVPGFVTEAVTGVPQSGDTAVDWKARRDAAFARTLAENEARERERQALAAQGAAAEGGASAADNLSAAADALGSIANGLNAGASGLRTSTPSIVRQPGPTYLYTPRPAGTSGGSSITGTH